MVPERIAPTDCHCGENPLWHEDDRRLYWCDIPRGKLYRYDPADGSYELCDDGAVKGGFTIQADGDLLLFGMDGRIWTWRDGRTRTILEGIPDEEGTRFNDVIADPAGRVFCGTMPHKDRPGSLYRLDTDGALTKVAEGVGCSNGLGFTPDRRGLYHTDTRKGEIYRYDYNVQSGVISNRTVFVHAPRETGGPDGMTVDQAGNVWSARWDDACLVRYRPDGVEDLRVSFPVLKVSSVTFGGEDYRDLYVTTAGGHVAATDGSEAGSLYRIRNAGAGVPEFRSRIGL